MSELRMQFGQKLRALRIQREMTQEDLAKITGFSIAFVSQMERGINAPSFESLEVLAKALDVSVSELFEVDDMSTPQGRRVRSPR